MTHSSGNCEPASFMSGTSQQGPAPGGVLPTPIKFIGRKLSRSLRILRKKSSSKAFQGQDNYTGKGHGNELKISEPIRPLDEEVYDSLRLRRPESRSSRSEARSSVKDIVWHQDSDMLPSDKWLQGWKISLDSQDLQEKSGSKQDSDRPTSAEKVSIEGKLSDNESEDSDIDDDNDDTWDEDYWWSPEGVDSLQTDNVAGVGTDVPLDQSEADGTAETEVGKTGVSNADGSTCSSDINSGKDSSILQSRGLVMDAIPSHQSNGDHHTKVPPPEVVDTDDMTSQPKAQHNPPCHTELGLLPPCYHVPNDLKSSATMRPRTWDTISSNLRVAMETDNVFACESFLGLALSRDVHGDLLSLASKGYFGRVKSRARGEGQSLYLEKSSSRHRHVDCLLALSFNLARCYKTDWKYFTAEVCRCGRDQTPPEVLEFSTGQHLHCALQMLYVPQASPGAKPMSVCSSEGTTVELTSDSLVALWGGSSSCRRISAGSSETLLIIMWLFR